MIGFVVSLFLYLLKKGMVWISIYFDEVVYKLRINIC